MSTFSVKLNEIDDFFQIEYNFITSQDEFNFNHSLDSSFITKLTTALKKYEHDNCATLVLNVGNGESSLTFSNQDVVFTSSRFVGDMDSESSFKLKDNTVAEKLTELLEKLNNLKRS